MRRKIENIPLWQKCILIWVVVTWAILKYCTGNHNRMPAIGKVTITAFDKREIPELFSIYGKTTSSIFRDNVTDHMLPISISQQNFRKEANAEVFL
jgi:hypothetical protein